jgi:hypothetical protein
VQHAAAALLRDGHDPNAALTVPATSDATSEESDAPQCTDVTAAAAAAADDDTNSTTATGGATAAAAAATGGATGATATATGPLAACSEACRALARAESVLARGASLLHKLPRQWALCEALLTAAEGDDCEVRNDYYYNSMCIVILV